MYSPLDTAHVWTIDALQSVWEHQQDRVYERIELIERAIAALAKGSLTAERSPDTGGCPGDDLHGEAIRAAHMLAGSLGMFGFTRASDAARELEVELEQPVPTRAAVLADLVAAVRSDLQSTVTFQAAPSPMPIASPAAGFDPSLVSASSSVPASSPVSVFTTSLIPASTPVPTSTPDPAEDVTG
jgi:HPt (histidine-containing phosphotransfer) domain-containing protein